MTTIGQQYLTPDQWLGGACVHWFLFLLCINTVPSCFLLLITETVDSKIL